MNRTEFVDKLRLALSGKIPVSKINEQVDYYNDYIMSEVRKGRSEQEVVESLGDPRLIAKSILASNGANDQTVDEKYSEDFRNDNPNRSWLFRFGIWPFLILAIIILIVVLVIVVNIAIFLMPVVIVVAAVLGILYFIKVLSQ